MYGILFVCGKTYLLIVLCSSCFEVIQLIEIVQLIAHNNHELLFVS